MHISNVELVDASCISNVALVDESCISNVAIGDTSCISNVALVDESCISNVALVDESCISNVALVDACQKYQYGMHDFMFKVAMCKSSNRRCKNKNKINYSFYYNKYNMKKVYRSFCSQKLKKR